jgi:hypothetical protein
MKYNRQDLVEAWVVVVKMNWHLLMLQYSVSMINQRNQSSIRLMAMEQLENFLFV